MSVITMMELIIGTSNKRETKYIQKAFKKIEIIYINEEISKKTYELIGQYSKSHNLHINDAFIAVTAIENNMTVVTSNISDFQFIPGISLYKI
jgi:predicted nucleic acid-binding protein